MCEKNIDVLNHGQQKKYVYYVEIPQKFWTLEVIEEQIYFYVKINQKRHGGVQIKTWNS